MVSTLNIALLERCSFSGRGHAFSIRRNFGYSLGTSRSEFVRSYSQRFKPAPGYGFPLQVFVFVKFLLLDASEI